MRATPSPGDPGGRAAAVVVPVSGEDREYAVVVESGLLDRVGSHVHAAAPAFRYAVISDDTVAGHYGDRLLRSMGGAGLDAELFTFPQGEREKTRERWRELTDTLLARGFGRDSAVVALGGGVTGDLAGFVAATYMRGIPLVQIPSTYVAMLDASVGGKTGVNVAAGKNLVGAFHPPRSVLIDPDLVATLAPDERRHGLAEGLKHGAILDAEYFGRLLANCDALLEGAGTPVADAVLRSVQLKAEVVGRDEREGGYREILNFGHTVGHAIEQVSGYAVPHGAAVSMGMVAEGRLGERLGVTEKGCATAIEEAVRSFGLPTAIPSTLEPRAIVEAIGLDKKVRRGAPRFVLLQRLGSVARSDGWAHEVESDSLLEEVLRGSAAGAAAW